MTEPVSPAVKCLLVDDLEENLLALSALLGQGDVQILTAQSGPEALELLLVHDVALALLDVQMPEMDGFELAEFMRGSARTRHVPIIFVTAGARDQHRLFKGYDTGAVDFLYKPVEPHILKSKADTFFQLHRQKQQLARELRERTQTLRINEMFTALLAHDLRSPLSSIVASAHVLERSGNELVKETAARMLSSGNRMSRMIEDMLDLARARLGGGISIKRAPADFGALIERAVREHRAAYPERRIEMFHDGDLGGEWDPDRISQVASNLIGNALKHGDIREPVHVRIDGADPGAVQFSVANVGVISRDALDHLFDPFRGAERRAGRDEGLGLGLYIVQQIVRAHQGSVAVESGRDGCTTFRVEIPRKSMA